MNGLAQNKSDDQLMSVAREIMLEANSCALITQDENGISRVRTMDPFAPEVDFTIWFGTNSSSRKVKQIMHNPNVTLYYTTIENTGYVTIHGTALIINDPIEKQNHWKEAWAAFYPNNPDGYALIKLSPKWMEVISEKHKILGDSINWKPQRVTFE